MKGLVAVALVLFGAPLCLADPPILVLVPQQLQFPAPFTISADPLKQIFILRNDSHADMEWSSRIATTTGGNWLSMSPSSGTVGPPPDPLPDGPTVMQTFVSVSPSGLKPGVYTGSITITASRLYMGVVYAATDSPQTVNVTYTIADSSTPTVRVSTNSASLSGVAGIGTVATAPITVTNGGSGTLNWTATIQNPIGVPWLSVAPASGVNAGSFTLTANASSLAAGVYYGAVAVAAAGSPTQVVTATYIVRAPKPPTLDLSNAPLNFSVMAGGNPASQSFAISNSGELPLNWKASASTFNGGQWLSVSPSAGTNNGMVVVSPTATALAPGIYAGRITVTSENTNVQTQLQVNLTVARNVPSLSGGGFYNAASVAPDGVVAGSIASIFGVRLGPETGAASTLDAVSGNLPTLLAGTRVTIDGVAAPLFYTSAKQINLQIPYEAAGKSSAIARIEAEGYDPADFKINLVPASVGLFTLDGMRVAALNQNGTLNSASNPAPAGSIVQFFATGQGVLDIPVTTGTVAPSQLPFPAPVTPLAVQIGGVSAKIVFSGLAPGSIGMLQLNVEIPAGTKASDLTTVQIQTGTAKPNVVYMATGVAQ